MLPCLPRTPNSFTGGSSKANVTVPSCLNEGKQYPRKSFTAADLQNAVLMQAIVLLKSARGGGEHVETGERRQKDMKMHSP